MEPLWPRPGLFSPPRPPLICLFWTKGPVEDALISIEGDVAMTDANGRLSTETESLQVMRHRANMGRHQNGHAPTKQLLGFRHRDTNRSLTHTFMASTVPSGEVSGWVVLERQWSPYTLDAPLVLQSASTMSIQDGVSLGRRKA